MRSRSAFTLIELMVAMALTLFVMVILSQAFVMSLDTFRAMKGIGDMQINLRTAEIILRDDLSQDHFTGKRRLSDPNFTLQPPTDGFFAVRRSSAPSILPGAPYYFEGADFNGVPSYLATDHMIYMTVKRKGNRQESFYNAPLIGDPKVLGNFFTPQTAYNVSSGDLANSTWAPGYSGGNSGVYASQWAEVLYYLIQTGTTENRTNPSVDGTRIYSLYRAQFVMVPDSSKVSGQLNGAVLAGTTFAGMSCNPGPGGKLKFYSPDEAAQLPGKRVIPDLTLFNPTANPRVFAGATLVCPNVLSFHVQVMPLGTTAFQDVPSNGVYDTTRFGVAGYPIGGLIGIQVTLRVWDFTTRQTRQVTIGQDL